MANKYADQYDRLGLEAPAADIDPRQKVEIIFYAACKKLGLDPAGLPVVHHLPEAFQAFPVASFQLEVIATALLNGEKKDYNSYDQEKYGPWFYMNRPGFRFRVVIYGVYTGVTGGPRLSLLSEEDAEFFAKECLSLWAAFCGGQLLA